MYEIKYSIIMPYYDRIDLLRQTFRSFAEFYHDREDFEVVIVEDQKQTEKMQVELRELISAFQRVFPIICIKSRAGICYNPATAYNEGVEVSRGTFLLLTNPECRHDVNILRGLDSHFFHGEEKYVICACKSLKADGKMHMWYQHSEHRNACYHFCSAIRKDLYQSFGGFNEEYTQGYGYEDNSFRDRVITSNIPIICNDELLVTHLWHTKVHPKDYRPLLNRNKALYAKEFPNHE